MDKVDAKTRETAVTLLDVLWTSKAAVEAVKPSTTPTSNSVNRSTSTSVNSIDSISMQVGTTKVLGSNTTTTTPRHGFDTNGWGNDTTAQQHQISTQQISKKPISANISSNADTTSTPQKPERDSRTSFQQRQSESSTAVAASSSAASIVPDTPVHKQEHQLESQNQQKRFEQEPHERNGNNKPSKIFQQNRFPGSNSNSVASGIASNTTPTMMSMTSVGFGIDNNNSSGADATVATIKAVQDAMERSTLRFQTFHSHSLQIKIQLGVPSIGTQGSSLDNSDSKVQQSQTKLQPMHVDLVRLSSILPQVIPILPVQIDTGGLFVPGESPGAPSICAVVACITLESLPHSFPSQPQLQPQPSPRSSVAPPSPPCPSLAPETSRVGLTNPKQVLTMASTSTAAKTMVYARTQRQEIEQQQQQQPCTQILPQPTKPLPSSTPTAQQRLEGNPIPPQQWDRGSSLERANEATRYNSKTASISSSSLPLRTQVATRSATSPTDQVGRFGGKNTEMTLKSKYNSAGVTTVSGNKRPYEEKKDGGKQKTPLRPARHQTNGTTKSIEILAMISEQEINRRNLLDANNSSTATSSSTSRVFSPDALANSSANGSSKSNAIVGILTTDTSTTSQRVTTGSTRYCKGADSVQTTQNSFAANQYNNIETFGYDQRNNSTATSESISKEERNYSDHFELPGARKKNDVEKTTTISSMGNSNLTKSASVRLSSRNSIKLGGGRGRGRAASYSDYSNEHPLPEERDCWALSTRTTFSPVFPLKLHETLTQIEKDGYDHIIGWLPHGRSFKIHKQKEFTDVILPRYFVMTKKSSFLRQLNLYSFNRFSAGNTNKGSYYHELFLRGKKFLSRRMTRQKVNGNRIRSAGNPDEEPDLSMYPICRDDDSNSKHPLSLPSSSSSSPSSIAASGMVGRTIVTTGNTPLPSSTPSSQPPLIHAGAASPTSDPSVSGTISGGNAVAGASPVLRVL